MDRRVVVTGIGVISPIGIGIENFWNSLVEGKSGIDKISRFDTEDFDVKIAAEVRDFEPEDFFERKEARRLDRYAQFAVACAKMALEDADLNVNDEIAGRTGVIIGSGVGGLETLEKQAQVLAKKGPGRVSPFFIPMMISNIAAGQIAIYTGAKGPNTSTNTACASSAHAIGEAVEIIRRNDADIMIAGGSEAAITPLAIAGFSVMKALSTNNEEPQKSSRPFDAKRDGFVMGEGACVLILEEYERAKKRGAQIYGEVRGYGLTGDAYHITAPAPEGEGAARAMKMALDKGGLAPEEVDYINAHGTSTPFNDKFETMAIKKVFGEHAYKLLISSTKSMTGHLLGGAGALEAAVCLLAMKNGVVPPTINYENPDPECDLNYVPNEKVEKEVRVALTNSLGFGGHNASLVFARV